MLNTIYIKNFKGIADSGKIKLTPLTVFVGYNGSGKSNVLEALEFFQTYAQQGLDTAAAPWLGMDHIIYQGVERKRRLDFYTHPMEFQISGRRNTQ